jgi:hypothetical protein
MRTGNAYKILLQRFKITATAFVFFVMPTVRRELHSVFDVLHHVSGQKYEVER